MCEIYAGQHPDRYRPVNRSVRIGGHSTSIQLEAAFWLIIDEIAESQGMSTARFLSELYDEAIQINGAIPNFASLLRTSALMYLMTRQAVPVDAHPELRIVAAE